MKTCAFFKFSRAAPKFNQPISHNDNVMQDEHFQKQLITEPRLQRRKKSDGNWISVLPTEEVLKCEICVDITRRQGNKDIILSFTDRRWKCQERVSLSCMYSRH